MYVFRQHFGHKNVELQKMFFYSAQFLIGYNNPHANIPKLFDYEHLEEKDRWMSEWISYKGDCRTAPATPGLLITVVNTCKHLDTRRYWSHSMFGPRPRVWAQL